MSDPTTSGTERATLMKRLLAFVKTGTFLLLAGGFAAGVIFWGGFNTAMEATNTMPFCISCHEMHDNVYQEYKQTIHYSNRTGVRAVCSDCHVPKDWTHKMIRKIQASNEVLHKILGSIDTPEKFNAKRAELAQQGAGQAGLDREGGGTVRDEQGGHAGHVGTVVIQRCGIKMDNRNGLFHQE